MWRQAYMLTDSFLFLLPFTPTDVLFIGHHIMTTSAAPRHASKPLMRCRRLEQLGSNRG